MIWPEPKLPWATILFAIVDHRPDRNDGGPGRPLRRAVRAARRAASLALRPGCWSQQRFTLSTPRHPTRPAGQPADSPGVRTAGQPGTPGGVTHASGTSSSKVWADAPVNAHWVASVHRLYFFRLP